MIDKIRNKKVSSSVLAIIILILVLFCLFVLFFEINDYRKIREEQHNFYYHFSADRINFKGKILLSSTDTIISLESNNITLTSTPIYYDDYNDKFILPSNMEIVYAYKNNPMYKVGKFSKVYYKNNYLYINSEAGIGRLYDCFFYDGEDLYAFIENTTVIINGTSYQLSPLSFVEVTKEYARIYNHKKDEYIFIDKYSGNVEAYTDEYAINLLNDTFTYGTSYYMLINNIDGLEFVEF